MKSKPASKSVVKTRKTKTTGTAKARTVKTASRTRKTTSKREEAFSVVTEKCDRCNGQGCIPVLCPKCLGRPAVMSYDLCRRCKGIGFIDVTCRHCKGTGEAPPETEPTQL
ncbi:MAG: hypothetical protein NZM31_06205 [Gemmatales bacterium]|nr:hypothetical protein [Gemmatales bacterium]MDW8386591.1 hypothetical protein [Gemmatales bacterium]